MSDNSKQIQSRYKLAVGLEYDEASCGTPSISSKGEALIADEIVKIAERFGVPVVEKPELGRALAAFNVDQQIPQSLYEAVAVVLNQIKKRIW